MTLAWQGRYLGRVLGILLICTTFKPVVVFDIFISMCLSVYANSILVVWEESRFCEASPLCLCLRRSVCSASTSTLPSHLQRGFESATDSCVRACCAQVTKGWAVYDAAPSKEGAVFSTCLHQCANAPTLFQTLSKLA